HGLMRADSHVVVRGIVAVRGHRSSSQSAGPVRAFTCNHRTALPVGTVLGFELLAVRESETTAEAWRRYPAACLPRARRCTCFPLPGARSPAAVPTAPGRRPACAAHLPGPRDRRARRAGRSPRFPQFRAT